MKYNFDDLADRSIDNARKWDENIVESKFPNVKSSFIAQWIADMDFKAAPEIRSALNTMSLNGAYGYTYSTERWFKSVIEWQKRRHNNDVNENWITLGYGTVPNMHILVQSMLDDGDAIVINTPIYGPFAYAARHNEKEVETISLIKKEQRYYIDWDRLESTLKKPKNKMLFFCNPHNPSGRNWSYEELLRIADICLKNNVLLVSDEVHSEHIISGKFVSSLQLPQKYLNNLVMLTSPNKGFNLGGLKLSYSIIPNEEIRNTFRKQYERNSVTSPNVPGQIAMITAYEKCDVWLDECVTYIGENLEIVQDYINKKFPEWELMKMESSYLPWVSVERSGYNMHEVAQMMAEEAGVVLGIGDDYVQDANDFLRLNIGTSHEIVEESMIRMSKVWQKNRK